jgi:ubiquinone/menaquinone biosynthesis C-methylase UbiE
MSLPPSRPQQRQMRRYAREAPRYDQGMDFFERRITGPEHREWACSRAIGRTLEVAIGTGLNVAHYPNGVDLTGLDLSPDMLELAEARSKSLGREIELIRADSQDMPFPDETFDTVLSTYALCSVPDDAAAIDEMGRVLRPGGRLILVDHVRSVIWPILWLQWLWELIPRHTSGEYMTRLPGQHVAEPDFEVIERDRLRAGIVERLVAIKN